MMSIYVAIIIGTVIATSILWGIAWYCKWLRTKNDNQNKAKPPRDTMSKPKVKKNRPESYPKLDGQSETE